MNQANYTDTVKHGVFASKFIYYVQVQLYMAYLDLEMCMFTAVNKNTSELYIEFIPLDTEVAQEYSDRAVQIIKASESNELMPKISEDPHFYVCRTCNVEEFCLGCKNIKVPIDSLSKGLKALELERI